MPRYRTEIIIPADRLVTLQLPASLPLGRAVVTVQVQEVRPAGEEAPEDHGGIEWWDEFGAQAAAHGWELGPGDARCLAVNVHVGRTHDDAIRGARDPHDEWIKFLSQYGRFRNYLLSALLFERLAADNDNPRKLELPKNLPIYSATGEYRPSELAAFFRREAEQLRDKFNQRNGTDYYDTIIEDYRQLAQPA